MFLMCDLVEFTVFVLKSIAAYYVIDTEATVERTSHY